MHVPVGIVDSQPEMPLKSDNSSFSKGGSVLKDSGGFAFSR